MLTLAQITDLHITNARDPVNRERNERRLRCVLDAIHARRPRPDAIIASGDLTDHGLADEYATLRAILADYDIPVYFGMGNHDRRGPFKAVFPDAPVDENGFVQYAVDLGGIRLVMLDTLDEGHNDGAFCDRRAAFAHAALGDPAPTIVAFHHPPLVSGIAWMDPKPDAPWIAMMAETLRGRAHILTAITGHLHRGFFAMFAGHSLSVGAATSIQLTLDLSPVDMRHADGREILVEEPPGYTLLVWDRGMLATHFCVAGDFPPAVTYDRPFISG